MWIEMGLYVARRSSHLYLYSKISDGNRITKIISPLLQFLLTTPDHYPATYYARILAQNYRKTREKRDPVEGQQTGCRIEGQNRNRSCWSRIPGGVVDFTEK